MSGALLRESLRVPLVLEFNGSEVWAQRHWGERLRFEALAERVERASLRHADLVVVVSQALVEQAVELGAARERVLFYPNGIDPLVFDPARFTAEDAAPGARGARRSRGRRPAHLRRDVRHLARHRRPRDRHPPADRRGSGVARAPPGPLPLRRRRRARSARALDPGGRPRSPLRHAGRHPAAGRDPAHARRLGHPALAARPEPRRHALLRQPDEALRVHGDGASRSWPPTSTRSAGC